MPKTIGYIRVSTIDQDTSKNKHDILEFANNRDFGKVVWVEEKKSGVTNWKDRKIKDVIDSLEDGDRIIVPELYRLGRSMLEIMEMLAIAKEQGIHIYAIKGKWELDGSVQSNVLAMAFAMAAEIEHDLISSRTKEALRARKAAGVKLGRPKGKGKSKLDPYREEIIALLKTGSTKTYLSKKYETSLPNLYNWLKKNNIHVEAEV